METEQSHQKAETKMKSKDSTHQTEKLLMETQSVVIREQNSYGGHRESDQIAKPIQTAYRAMKSILTIFNF